MLLACLTLNRITQTSSRIINRGKVGGMSSLVFFKGVCIFMSITGAFKDFMRDATNIPCWIQADIVMISQSAP